MELQIVTDMKKKITFFVFLSVSFLHAQKTISTHFFIGNEKIKKPIKYVSYNPNTDIKKDVENKIYFYIKDEVFVFLKNSYKLDTCYLSFLKNNKIEKVEGLSNKEYLYYKQKVNEVKNKKNGCFGPMPITRNHNYFRIIVLERHKNKILKYDVDWTYTGTRGFRIKK